MKRYRDSLYMFSWSFSVVAMILLGIIFSSVNAMCADAPLISLPTEKNEVRNKATASSAKKGNAREAVVSEDMLQGVFYDLKQTRDGRSNKEFSTVSSNGEYISNNLAPTLKVVQSFVNGSWQKKLDINGCMNYSALNAYYSPTTPVWISSFYTGDIPSKTAPQAFGYPNDVKPNCWICIYSGYVVAPFSGKFRFVGFGDDFLVVRFNQRIVFDYGRISATLGAALGTQKRSTLTSSTADSEKSQSSKNPIERVMPTINKGESGENFYSKNRLVIRSPEYMNDNNDFGSGLANGSVIDVRQGEVLPIEILVGDIGGNFNYVLFVERLDANGMALDQNRPLLLFRTSEDLPPSFTSSSAVAYDKNSPIWKVVDAKGRSIPSHNPSIAKKDASSKTGASSSKKAVPDSQIEVLDMLPGVYYDLRRPTKEEDVLLKKLSNSNPQLRSKGTTPDTTEVNDLLSVLNKFVLGKWEHSFDKNGFPVYTDLQQYFRYPLRAYSSAFYIGDQLSTSFMKQFNDENASAFGWISIHSGYVVAPFTGQFRFVGCGDDALVVRFNQRLVLDYGYSSLSLGKSISGPNDCVEPNNSGQRLLPEKGLYSDKLELYFPNSFKDRGVAKGVPINVTKGKVYPIEILSSDVGGAVFSIAVFVERLDSNGKPLNENPARLPLFRTSSKIPRHPSTVYLPDFDEDSPIWKVVDSKGKTIPLRNSATADIGSNIFSPMAPGLIEKKQPSASTSPSSQETPASTQQKSNPKPTSKRGNITTQTIVENNGDTTIETVTTTEENDDTILQTTVVTETKNGKVMKKTTTTSTTTKEKPTSKTNAEQPSSSGTSTTKTSSAGKTDSSTTKKITNPFGTTQRPIEDDE